MQIKSPLSGSKQERDEPKSSSNPVVNVFRKFTGFGSKKAVVEESKSSLVDDPTQDRTDNRIPDNYQGDFAAESEGSDDPFDQRRFKDKKKPGVQVSKPNLKSTYKESKTSSMKETKLTQSKRLSDIDPMKEAIRKAEMEEQYKKSQSTSAKGMDNGSSILPKPPKVGKFNSQRTNTF